MLKNDPKGVTQQSPGLSEATPWVRIRHSEHPEGRATTVKSPLSTLTGGVPRLLALPNGAARPLVP